VCLVDCQSTEVHPKIKARREEEEEEEERHVAVARAIPRRRATATAATCYVLHGAWRVASDDAVGVRSAQLGA
jgi:hypothetical protein